VDEIAGEGYPVGHTVAASQEEYGPGIGAVVAVPFEDELPLAALRLDGDHDAVEDRAGLSIGAGGDDVTDPHVLGRDGFRQSYVARAKRRGHAAAVHDEGVVAKQSRHRSGEDQRERAGSHGQRCVQRQTPKEWSP
jgi:hypothetical protein